MCMVEVISGCCFCTSWFGVMLWFDSRWHCTYLPPSDLLRSVIIGDNRYYKTLFHAVMFINVCHGINVNITKHPGSTAHVTPFTFQQQNGTVLMPISQKKVQKTQGINESSSCVASDHWNWHYCEMHWRQWNVQFLAHHHLLMKWESCLNEL